MVLEDTNDDGKMDKRTIFADKLVMPRAIKVLDKGVPDRGIPPNLWYLQDTDGDLKADTKEKVVDTYGRGGNVEHDANSLMWAMDNIMYSVRAHVGPAVETRQVRVSAGRSTADNGKSHRTMPAASIATSTMRRSSSTSRQRGTFFAIRTTRVRAVSTSRSSSRWTPRCIRCETRAVSIADIATNYFRADGSSIVIQGTSGPAIYRGDRYPESVRGDAFIADSPTNLVHQMTIVDDGSGRLTAKNTLPAGRILCVVR